MDLWQRVLLVFCSLVHRQWISAFQYPTLAICLLSKPLEECQGCMKVTHLRIEVFLSFMEGGPLNHVTICFFLHCGNLCHHRLRSTTLVSVPKWRGKKKENKNSLEICHSLCKVVTFWNKCVKNWTVQESFQQVRCLNVFISSFLSVIPFCQWYEDILYHSVFVQVLLICFV